MRSVSILLVISLLVPLHASPSCTRESLESPSTLSVIFQPFQSSSGEPSSGSQSPLSSSYSIHAVIRNSGSSGLTVRDVGWAFPSSHSVTFAWNADVSTSETADGKGMATARLTVGTPEGFVPSGEALAFGFNGEGPGGPSAFIPPQNLSLTVCHTTGGNTSTPTPPTLPPTTTTTSTLSTTTTTTSVVSTTTTTMGSTTSSSSPLPPSLTPEERFNLAVGTQTIAPFYKFTSDDRLLETAKRVQSMGSNILKISLDPDMYQLQYSVNKWDPVAVLSGIPSYETVLRMPFAVYMFWLETAGDFLKPEGFTDADYERTMQSVKALTSFLLETFKDTGKVFMIGNWEGDWHLVNDPGAQTWNIWRQTVPKGRINAMKRWVQARQEGVVQGRESMNLPISSVSVLYYLEVNLVETARGGYDRISNLILPFVPVDLVSYSAYDSTARSTSLDEARFRLSTELNYLEAQMKKAGTPPQGPVPSYGKRVFVGEFGFPFGRMRRDLIDPLSAEEQDLRSQYVVRAALEWGTPFILYWQMYGNEYETATQRFSGFWLVNNLNEDQPVFGTLRNLLRSGREKYEEIKKEGREPTTEEVTVFLSTRIGNSYLLSVQKYPECN
uniref:CBM2 domain-containing protein n=1 Tax=Chromera velia CCMP2878 TaxID=1169474 RepID=A0A0G4I3A5_9ALVE|eukprot:Cvel_10599.t1-p1 / transcript=Cvel_10599.t1 / gene=Cvel_10599 / organism=Chromera_velia_CCMP2878 / gene_product=hypothetical protein / transcript_product=hypothetical protein / location=Cvel_scaffold643:7734-10360(+) / protein_length=611 / sequence_SO=supercontig / SO=protein_coding / is_pseudo=false